MKNNFLVIFTFLLVSCTQSSSTIPTATELPSLTPIATQQDSLLPMVTATQQDPLLSEIHASFSTSPHASSFSCEKCHSVTEGEAESQLVWIDNSTGQTEFLSKATQLCVKCHASKMVYDGSQEIAWLAHMYFECTNCHDAHNTTASCTQSGCHVDQSSSIFAQIEKPQNHTDSGNPDSHMCGGSACHEQAKLVAQKPIYHQPVHRNVPCYVCHDVSGMMVIMEAGQWITVLAPGQDNGAELLPQVSHTIGLEVQCEKCHHTDNAWTLNEISPEN